MFALDTPLTVDVFYEQPIIPLTSGPGLDC